MKKWIPMMILLTMFFTACSPTNASTPTASNSTPPQENTGTAHPTEQLSTAQPDEPETAMHKVAYIGADGNLWLVDPANDIKKQITTDAAGYNTNNAAPVITYQEPIWSSDGRYLAFERSQGTPNASGYQYAYDLMIYDDSQDLIHPALENQQTAGMAWKPGTHLLAYAKPTDPNYFTARGETDATLANGIWVVNVDSGSATEIVKPEAGYNLVNPRWAPNAKVLSFEEVFYMEGRGPFAYYDFDANQYVRWETAIGNVDWAPDASQLLHDNLNYTPSYTERIYRINRDRSDEQQLSPDMKDGYAYNPLYSPSGDRMVYISVQGMDPDITVKVMVQDLPDDQPVELISLTQIYYLTWTPDGQHLLYAAGNYPDTQVTLFSLEDRSQKVLADGWQAVMQP